MKLDYSKFESSKDIEVIRDRIFNPSHVLVACFPFLIHFDALYSVLLLIFVPIDYYSFTTSCLRRYVPKFSYWYAFAFFGSLCITMVRGLIGFGSPDIYFFFFIMIAMSVWGWYSISRWNALYKHANSDPELANQ